MMAHAVGHRLNQHRPLLLNRHLPRALRDLINRYNIIPIDPYRVDAIANASARDTIAFVLFERRRGDSVAVVAANEDDGAAAGGGDVERGVEVTFGGRTFAEIAGDDIGGVVEFQRVAASVSWARVGTGGVRTLRPRRWEAVLPV